MKVYIPIVDWKGAKLAERAKTIINPEKARHSIIALADHGVADSMLSLQPKTYTWAQAVLISEGEHACQNVGGLQNQFYDISIDRYFAELTNIETETKVARCSQNLLSQNSLEGPRLQKAVELGFNEGSNFEKQALVLSDIGAGSEISLLFSAHHLLAKKELLNDWPQNLKNLKGPSQSSGLQPMKVLENYGGYDTAFLLGAILGAVSKENFLFLGGMSAMSAGLIAVKLSNNYSQFLCSTGVLPYTCLQKELEKLGIEPISNGLIKPNYEKVQLEATVNFLNQL